MIVDRSSAITDAGRRRRRNEDAYVCEPPLFAVADGMGGAQAGEVASRLAAAALRAPSEEAPTERDRMLVLIREANRRVFERASEDETVSGMGTTLTVALVADEEVWFGHVGDSRAYLIRGHRLEQLTEDHSLVAELVRSGELSPEEAESHPQRSVITRALGTEAEVEIDSFCVPAQPGDLFVLCSDGLTSMVGDDAILAQVERHRNDLGAAGRALVDEANRAGGEDNVTVVLFEIGPRLEDTAELPASALEGGQGSDDETTLTELDGVPTVEVEAAAPPPDPARAPARRRRRRWPLVAVVALGLVALAAAAGVFALSRSHFVGAERDGHVAVYQGVPWELAADVRLYRIVYESPLLTAQLSRAERRDLFDHDLQSKAAALREVERYEQDVVP